MTMKMGAFEKRFVNAAAHSRHVGEQMVRRLRHVPLQPGWRYLEVGCGNGAAARRVADTLGLRVVGIDLDAAQIELARRTAGRRSDMSFVTASATQLPFASAVFDVVSTSKTLHHIPEWWLAVGELTRVAAPGGYVVFADLKIPLALAPLLRHTVGHAAGVFTRRDLDRGFSGLRSVHRNVHWLHYEAVFAKP